MIIQTIITMIMITMILIMLVTTVVINILVVIMIVRPISLLTLWISEGLTQTQS